MTASPTPSPDPGHAPVMPEEVIAGLRVTPGDVVLDCTAGRGGHASLLAAATGSSGTVVLCDLDPENLDFATNRVRTTGITRVIPFQGSFARVPRDLRAEGLLANAVLADLGFASTQIDDPSRGFSFMREGPLDMRMDPTRGMTAADVLASSDERELTRIISEYGEEPLARRIARNVVQKRADEPILTTADLAGLVRDAYGQRAASSRLHPATRTFQALRIAVNDEFGALDGLLRQVMEAAEAIGADRPTWLADGARVAFLTFHSLEDRRVKRAFVELDRRGLGSQPARMPILPSETEIVTNSRSRSAKLRVATVGGRSGQL
ncbi:MAG: 16S rRNA (cytosine(1402)-N(4))-methyltransferase RsmH [Planctomycetota bacterium]|nr:16S rRNA (cytosine(1402)-N(4))-methyltransferase RsmH [Planctomycetota bacterium]